MILYQLTMTLKNLHPSKVSNRHSFCSSNKSPQIHKKNSPSIDLLVHKDSPLQWKTFRDLNWTTCRDNKKSINNYCIFLDNSLIMEIIKKNLPYQDYHPKQSTMQWSLLSADYDGRLILFSYLNFQFCFTLLRRSINLPQQQTLLSQTNKTYWIGLSHSLGKASKETLSLTLSIIFAAICRLFNQISWSFSFTQFPPKPGLIPVNIPFSLGGAY